MINQTAKKILKALSFDGVEVEAFRHMADLKRLDPMKIFYKKIDEKIYNGSHAVPIRIFFPTEKSFRESEEKKHNIQDKKMLLFIHGGGWVTESIDNYERICARLANATGQYVVAVEPNQVSPLLQLRRAISSGWGLACIRRGTSPF